MRKGMFVKMDYMIIEKDTLWDAIYEEMEKYEAKRSLWNIEMVGYLENETDKEALRKIIRKIHACDFDYLEWITCYGQIEVYKDKTFNLEYSIKSLAPDPYHSYRTFIRYFKFGEFSGSQIAGLLMLDSKDWTMISRFFGTLQSYIQYEPKKLLLNVQSGGIQINDNEIKPLNYMPPEWLQKFDRDQEYYIPLSENEAIILGEYNRKEQRITIYKKAIEKVTDSDDEFCDLFFAVYVHELFHAFHATCYEDITGKNWTDYAAENPILVESLAAAFEYSFIKHKLHNDKLAEKRKSAWEKRSMLVNPYAGAKYLLDRRPDMLEVIRRRQGLHALYPHAEQNADEHLRIYQPFATYFKLSLEDKKQIDLV